MNNYARNPFFLAAGLTALVAATASATTVFSNSGGGDNFTNATGTNTGQAVGASGWYYNNVRNNGTVGVNSTYARNGNGSAYFNLAQGDPASSKADIEFYNSAAANPSGNYGATSALGTLGSLNSLSYSWYRDGSSAASAWLHPVIRLSVVSSDLTQSGYLVFEREYNGMSSAPTDTWVTENVFGNDYRMWSTGSTLPNNINGTNGSVQLYDARTISQWMSDFGSYYVTGVSLGAGSGWDTFTGAVDDVAFGFTGGANYNFNFEVVPAPGALALLGLAGLTGSRRRRN